MTDRPCLSLQHLTRRFSPGSPPAVDDLSLQIAGGEIVALIGPSGCGKTTTLRMIAGFERPDTGRILLEGRDITNAPPEARGIGMVFQDYALFPHMTVAENIAFGARDRRPEAIAGHLAMVGLAGLGERYPDELSGGQQQRVALARSLAAGPGLILLDEPFSNLDSALRTTTRREIRRLLKASGVAILLVTHDQEEAMSFADRVVVMHAGRIVQQGQPQQVYTRPANAFVAGFLGRTNLIEGVAEGDVAQTPLGPVPLDRPHHGPALLSLRPEVIRLSPAGPQAKGCITGVEFRGHDLTWLVHCGGIELQVDAMGPERYPEGSAVSVSVVDVATVVDPHIGADERWGREPV